MIRPRQRQLRAQQRQMAALEVGDEIVTAGGLYGTVRALEEDELRLEIAPGIEVRVARRAVAGIISDKTQEEPEQLEPAEEPEERTEANLPG